MAETEYYVDNLNRQQARKRISGDEASGAVSTSRMRTTAGAGLGSQGDEFKPPKQTPGEDSAAYGARVAKAREAFRQRKAMR